MTPILAGIVASGISGHLTPPFSPTGSYDALASYTVPSGGVSSITFAGLPTGGQYSHLQLRITHNQSVGGVSTYIAFNGDTDYNNYVRHIMGGDGSGVFGFGQINTADTRSLLYINTAGGVPAATIMDLLDYANPNKAKTFKTITGKWYNSSDNTVAFENHLWTGTAPVNSITLTTVSGVLTEFSKFSLYGVKG